jgi:predicted transposase/invertase (TIGR01784 family)
MSKYINPYTDFGFKKLFGEEASKPALQDFLNALLPARDKIASLTFNNPEHLGQTEADRRAIFDIYCENERGEKFIVELQKAKQNYFKERTVYYATFPIREQAEKGEWNYQLKAVYCIGILDFTFDDYGKNDLDKNQVIHTVELKDQNNHVFYDKLKFIYLEMPNFNKQEHDLATRLDKWLYFIKHLADLQTMPAIFKEEVFTSVLQKAEIAKLNKAELDTYEQSLKTYRDIKGVIDTAFDEGKLEGKIEGKLEGVQEGIALRNIELALAMLADGEPLSKIARYTGLTEDDMARPTK